MFKRKRSLGFLFVNIALSVMVVLFLTVCSGFGTESKQVKATEKMIHSTPAVGLNVGWQAKYGPLNLKALEGFIKRENIKFITLVGEKGTMYVVDVNGNEIGFDPKNGGKDMSHWCKVSGTQLEEGCIKMNAHTITNTNQMTTIFTHGSPYQILIQVDGYMICWDLLEQRRCD